MRKSKRVTVIVVSAVVALAMLAGGASVLIASQTGKPSSAEASDTAVRPVKTFTIAGTGQMQTRTYPASVRANESAVLAFRVPGPLIAFPSKPGQSVRKGDVLARIDPRDYATQLAEIQAAIDQAQANLTVLKTGERTEMVEVMRAQLKAAKARELETKTDYSRVRGLHDRDAATAWELIRNQCAYDTAVASVKIAEENLKMAETGARAEDIEALEAQIRSLNARRQAAQDALADTDLRAPFDGQVAQTYVDNYVNVKTGTQILLLQDVAELELVIHVPEKEIAEVASGLFPEAAARFHFLADRTFPLTFKEMDTVGDPQTQTYPITLTMTAPQDARVLPGMSAEVDVQGPATASTLGVRVPAAAVCNDQHNQAFVWRVNSTTHTVTQIPVTCGPIADGWLNVVGHLNQGDAIVTAGASFLTEGMQVRPQ